MNTQECARMRKLGGGGQLPPPRIMRILRNLAQFLRKSAPIRRKTLVRNGWWPFGQ